MERLDYFTRRFCHPVDGDTLDIQFNRAPSKLTISRLRMLEFKFDSKIQSWRGHKNFDEALAVAEQAKQKSKTCWHKYATLCWECDNCYGGCAWSRSFKPVEGWTAIPTEAHITNGKYSEVRHGYTVLKCPEFVKDRRRKKHG